MPAIWSLHASVNYIVHHREKLQNREYALTQYMMEKLGTLDNVILYDRDADRISTFSINIKDVTSDKLVTLLDNYGICVRGGIHCAILAHEAIGTVSTGTVRISLSYYNTKEEVDTLIEVLKKIGE